MTKQKKTPERICWQLYSEGSPQNVSHSALTQVLLFTFWNRCLFWDIDMCIGYDWTRIQFSTMSEFPSNVHTWTPRNCCRIEHLSSVWKHTAKMERRLTFTLGGTTWFRFECQRHGRMKAASVCPSRSLFRFANFLDGFVNDKSQRRASVGGTK